MKFFCCLLLFLSTTSVFAKDGQKADPHACDDTAAVVVGSSSEGVYYLNNKAFWTRKNPGFCFLGTVHGLLNDPETALNYCKLAFPYRDGVTAVIDETNVLNSYPVAQIAEAGAKSFAVDLKKESISVVTCAVQGVERPLPRCSQPYVPGGKIHTPSYP